MGRAAPPGEMCTADRGVYRAMAALLGKCWCFWLICVLHISGLLTQDVIFLMSSAKFCLFMGTDIAELMTVQGRHGGKGGECL